MSAEAQPSPEELQAYLEQMRDAEPAEIVAQAFQILAMGAEVKLGRPDARLLIDMLSAMTDGGGARLPANLADGMRTAVRQLQMAQVDAERQAPSSDEADAAGAPAASGAPDEAAGGQAGQAQAPPPGPGQGGQGQPRTQPGPAGGPGQDQKMTDRLWIPGR
jgi:hypothetical protein